MALDATGLSLTVIAERTGVSTGERAGRPGTGHPRQRTPTTTAPLEPDAAPDPEDHSHRDQDDTDTAGVEPDAAPETDTDTDTEASQDDDDDNEGEGAEGAEDAKDTVGAGLVVLAAPVPRHLERAAARAGELTEAPVVITEGARLPLAGLLLALPALEMTGLLQVAQGVFGARRNGFYGLRATLLSGVFLALLREPRAEGATRVRPADLGRVFGLDRAPEVKTLRRKLTELAAHARGADLQAALASLSH